MPEMTFSVRWPDGIETTCYSPSLVMHDYLSARSSYPVADFVARSCEALGVASERVRATFGVACTSAMQQADEIKDLAAGYPTGTVTVLRMEPPLPGTVSATSESGASA